MNLFEAKQELLEHGYILEANDEDESVDTLTDGILAGLSKYGEPELKTYPTFDKDKEYVLLDFFFNYGNMDYQLRIHYFNKGMYKDEPVLSMALFNEVAYYELNKKHFEVTKISVTVKEVLTTMKTWLSKKMIASYKYKKSKKEELGF